MNWRSFFRGFARCFDIFGVLGPQTVDEHLACVDEQLGELGTPRAKHADEDSCFSRSPSEGLWVAECSCGYVGPNRFRQTEAERDVTQHKLESFSAEPHRRR